MKSLWTLLVAATLVIAGPAMASAADVKVSGGGSATFDFFDGGTMFSVQAHIDADGNVKGHFMCMVPAIVVIVGDDLVGGTLNDDGSVTLWGYAHGYDAAGGVFQDMPFAVRLWAGGPGAGKFIYDDPVVGPSGGVDLDEGDHETVATGQIRIAVK